MNVATQSVSWSKVKVLHNAYWQWDSALRATPWSRRGANIPEALTEAIVCLCTQSELIISGSGDILLPSGSIGEVKASSKSTGDLSSFSPSETWDSLFFVIAKPNDQHDYHVYDTGMDREQIGKIKVSRTETFDQQAASGRRPRFSVIEKVLIANLLEPKWKVNIENQTINGK